MQTTTDTSTRAPVRRPGRRRRGVLVLLMAAGLMASTLTACFPSVGTDFADPGPFTAAVQTDAEHTYYYPTELGRGGVRHPVVLWGNGTYLRPEHYDALLRHLATHGFIVAAANTSNAGSGREMLAGLDNLTRFDADPQSRFYRRVDTGTVGTMGHSQGGGGAIEAARDPRVDTAVPLEPFLGNAAGLHGPTFFMSGENDNVIPPASVRQKYEASSHVPAAYGDVAGADHITPALDAGAFRGPITAWLRWHLMVDPIAKQQFVGDCAYCSSDVFTTYEANPGLDVY